MSDTRRMLLDFETDEVGRKARDDPKVRKSLIKALSDTSDIVRQRALIATIELGDPTIVKDIVKSLKDEDDEVRVAAAESLAYYRQPSTIPYLLEGLKDSNTWVRSHCANGLSKLIGGPIWARLKEEDVDTILADFPEMDEEQIRQFMIDLKVRENELDKFMHWRRKNFEIDIDPSIIEELETKPLILEGADISAPVKPTSASGISTEVEEILAELPDDIRSTLPEEDLRRLTPSTARELVDSLLASFVKKEEEKPKKKKKVRVKKVQRSKKKKGPTKEEMLEKIPEEIRTQIPPDVLDDLTVEDLEALISADSDGAKLLPDIKDDETIVKPSKPKKHKKMADARFQTLTDKYGEEKAEILLSIPEDMLAGIPDDQIEEMDIDSLRDLADALAPR